MRRHLKQRELIGYLVGTLSDAQRETMDNHLADCALCRTKLEQEQLTTRQIQQEIRAAGRSVTPSAEMNFERLRGQLPQQRRQARVRYWTQQIASTAGVLASLLLLVMIVSTAVRNKVTLEEDQPQALQGQPLFDIAWDDATPYRAGLIDDEQTILRTLPETDVYHIDITLAEQLDTLNGRVAIRYVNRTDQPQSEIYLRLLPNAGSSDMSLQSVQINGRPVVMEQINELDVRLPLVKPLAAAETAVVNITYQMQIGTGRLNFPGTVGYISGMLNLAHFYPVIAAYDNVTESWNLAAPVQGIGNVTADSFYLVRVTAPQQLQLIGSGVEMTRQTMTQGGQDYQIVTFAAGPLDQFVLVASDAYETVVSRTVGETTVNVYVYADYLADDATAAVDYALSALQVYEDTFGPYPFTELDLVGTPTLSLDMQVAAYPGMALLAMDRFVSGEASLEKNVVYALAYQWFGRVGRQRLLSEPWLGYGLSQYALRYYFARTQGQTAVDELVADWQKQAARTGLDTTAAVSSAERFAAGEFYEVMLSLAPLRVDELARTVGDDAFTTALKHYYQQQKWSLGTSLSFLKYVEAACGCTLEEG